jgi:hypothetical protein
VGLADRLRVTALLVVFGGLVVGCGSTSKSEAVSILSSSLSSIAYSGNASALAQCVGDRLFDSGNFNSDEIQKLISSSSTDLASDLNNRWNTQVVAPCLAAQTTTSSSSSSSATSSGT